MKIVPITLALLMATTSAYAWTAKTGGSGPQAIGQDGGSATAQAQRQGQIQKTRNTAKGGSSNVNVNNSVTSGGGTNGAVVGDLAVTTPEGFGNAPCGGGIGLGGLGLSGGGSGGGTLWEFGDCKRMRESSALRSLGYPDAALAELCQIDRVREAFGGKCPTHDVATVTDVNGDKPDYCFTRNPGDVNQHRECDRTRKVVH